MYYLKILDVYDQCFWGYFINKLGDIFDPSHPKNVTNTYNIFLNLTNDIKPVSCH